MNLEQIKRKIKLDYMEKRNKGHNDIKTLKTIKNNVNYYAKSLYNKPENKSKEVGKISNIINKNIRYWTLEKYLNHISTNNLVKLNNKEIKQLKKEYPNIPIEYIDFLRNVGTGIIGNSSFVFYKNLIKAEEIYDSYNPKLEDIVLIGDDFRGNSIGFLITNNWEIVKVTKYPLEVHYLYSEKKFNEVIVEYLNNMDIL